MPHGCQITFTPRDSGAVRTLAPSTPTTPSKSGFDSALGPTASTSSLSSHLGSSPHRQRGESGEQDSPTSVAEAHIEEIEAPSDFTSSMPTAHTSVTSPPYMTQRVPADEDYYHRHAGARHRKNAGLGFQDSQMHARRGSDDMSTDDMQPHSCPPPSKRNFAPTTPLHGNYKDHRSRPVSATLPLQSTNRENVYASASASPKAHSGSAGGKRPYTRPASLATVRYSSAELVARSQLGSPYIQITPPADRSSQFSVASSSPKPILFYHKHDPYYGFTNFSDHPVIFDNKTYPTSEHLFQASKFLGYRPLLAEHIRKVSRRPAVAFSEARRFQPEVRPDWLQVNIEMMDRAIYHKFKQHHDLREELLSTGDAELIEDSDKDAFWGVGADRKGRNELGKALMRLRDILRREQEEEEEARAIAEAAKASPPPSTGTGGLNNL
ncbi:DUF1768-domain-containing protein [Schizophyllum commune Tattone D]|nr:DUF1768-domain-containing protein [Schizophyllum commune Tattone D]